MNFETAMNIFALLLLVFVSISIFSKMTKTIKFDFNIHTPDQILIKVGVDPKDIEKCKIWALGEDYGIVKISLLSDRFRTKHPECQMVYDHTRIVEFFEIIGRSYLESLR